MLLDLIAIVFAVLTAQSAAIVNYEESEHFSPLVEGPVRNF